MRFLNTMLRQTPTYGLFQVLEVQSISLWFYLTDRFSTLGLCGFQHSRLVIGRFSVRISDGTPSAWGFPWFPQSLQAIAGIVPQLCQDSFFPNHPQFIAQLTINTITSKYWPSRNIAQNRINT
jgi:hypothetical protein